MRLFKLIVLGLVTVASVSRAGGQLLVASNHPGSSSFARAPNDTQFEAQTFTPATTGLLTAVNLPFFTSSPTTDIMLRLTTADAMTGLPGATTLATVSLSPEQVTYSTYTTPLYTTFDFSGKNLTLNEGTPYALVLSTTSFNFAYFVLTSPDAYAGGQALESFDSGATYTPLISKNLDWAFDVQEIPEPSSLLVPVLTLMCLPRHRFPLSIVHCQLLPRPLRQLNPHRIVPGPQDQ